VSLREIARAGGVRPFTVQHHFGSKLELYQEVLCRWDGEVLERVSLALKDTADFSALVRRVVDELFDFLLERRSWMAVNARAALGEGLPEGARWLDRSWARFVDAALGERGRDTGGLDTGLLLITVEGILNHHVLSGERYRQLFDRDVTEPALRTRTKRHLERVLLAILSDGPDPRRVAAGP
jgi:AcrR family transcriptional regulator